MAGREINVADVSASFQQAVLDVVVDKTMMAVRNMNKDRLVIAGGVAANSELRRELKEVAIKKVSDYMRRSRFCARTTEP